MSHGNKLISTFLVEIGPKRPFAISIENKPWAGERPNQVFDYCAYLEKHFNERWWFGYLSGRGFPPPEHSLGKKERKDLEAKGQFRTIPFVSLGPANELSLEDWFARCAEVCIAERVRWFLRDMSDYIGGGFGNLESDERT